MTDAELKNLCRPTVQRIIDAAAGGATGDQCAAILRELLPRVPRPVGLELLGRLPRMVEIGEARRASQFSAEDAREVTRYFAADANGELPGDVYKEFAGVTPREFAELSGARMKFAADGKSYTWLLGSPGRYPGEVGTGGRMPRAGEGGPLTDIDDDDDDDDSGMLDLADIDDDDAAELSAAMADLDREPAPNPEHMEALTDAIIAALAEGDHATADRLTELADDPEQLAELLDGEEFSAPGAPPRPGLVWREQTHRWIRPDTGEEHPHEPAPTTTQPTDTPAADPESTPHERKLLARVKDVPRALVKKVKATLQSKYAKLSERYGPTGAKAVLAAAVALTPVPLPGTTLLPIAIAEGVRLLHRAIAGAPAAQTHASAPALDVQAEAMQLLRELYAEMGEELPEQFAAPGPAPRPGLAWKESTHRWIRPDDGAAPGKPGATPAAEPPARSGSASPPAGSPPDRAAATRYTSTAKERTRPKHLARATKFKDVARRRRIVAALKNEAELATAIDGHNLPDSEPADVVHIRDAAGNPVTDNQAVKDQLRKRAEAVKALSTGKRPLATNPGPLTDEERDAYVKILEQPADFYEVKTLLTSSKDSVYMNPGALARKQRWAKKYGISFHVVAVDSRRGQKHSGHRVYVAANVDLHAGGTVKLSSMTKAGSLAHIAQEVSR